MSRAALVLVLVAACGQGGPSAAPPPAMAKPQAVSIKLRNHRVGPIWVAVPGPCSDVPARLETKAGVQLPFDDVTVSCVDAAEGNCAPAVCPGARAIRIDGDGEVTLRWSGQIALPRTLGKTKNGCPKACVDRGGPPPATDHWLRAEAWSTCVGDDCACTVAKPGQACARPAALTGAPDLKAATPIDVPSALGVTIMFE